MPALLPLGRNRVGRTRYNSLGGLGQRDIVLVEQLPRRSLQFDARLAVRQRGPAGAPTVTDRALCDGGLENSPSLDRLSRRDRPALLQRSVSVGRPTTGSALYRSNRRDH